MGDARAGHHADFVYLHEDGADGLRGSPSDSTQKIFGANQTLDTYQGGHQAVRVWNSNRTAADVVKQLFDGAWSVSGELGPYPPWWLAEVFGTPSSTSSVSTSVHTYGLNVAGTGDPQPMRIITEVSGASPSFDAILGCVPQTLTVNQDVPGNPEFTLDGVYAEPSTMGSTVTAPSFTDDSYTWSDARLDVNGSTIARVQNTGVTYELNADLIPELGSEYAVDFSPKVFAPQVEYEKIVRSTPSVDLGGRFLNGSAASAILDFDNGASGASLNRLEFRTGGAIGNDVGRSGQNDPEADLVDSLTEMALDATVVLETNSTAQ